MNSNEEYNVAARYRTVRKRLDSLGYQQALSLDALPLIERLLADLVQTTESLKHFKSVAQDNIEACNQLQLIIDPYKCDNARLVQECNQLHLDLIETEEAYQKQIKDLKKQVYKLECECNDLQLASSRNLQKIKDLEIESAKKSKKILDLQGKCLKPIISNVGIANKKRPCYPLRRPVIEAEPLPKIGSSNNTLPSVHAVEPKILDLLSMADHKMSSLTHEVTKLKGELSLQTDNVYTLQDQLTTKEKEIMRLKKMLEGGRPYNAVAKDCLCKKADKAHAVPNATNEENDLRTLLESKQQLEQQLKEAISKQHEAMSQAMKLAERNEELEKELRDIDHIALAVEADCNSTVKENNKRVCRLQEKLEDVVEQVHTLENELGAKRREVQELTADLEACKLEKRNIQRTLESTVEENKKVTNKINQLTIIEKSLNEEIERLSTENESQKQDIIQLQYTNKVLKEQLSGTKVVEDVLGDGPKQSKEKGEKNDQNRGKKNMGCRRENREHSSSLQETNIGREENKSTNNGTPNHLQNLITEKDIQIDNLQQTIKQLENERDYYRNECNCTERQKEESSNKENVELWTRSYELRCQLNEKEKTIFELQKEKNDLYREKMELEARLEAYKNQQKRSCTSCKSCKMCKPIGCYAYQPSTVPFDVDNNTTKVLLDSLEHERDTARADVQRLTEERNALYEQLKRIRRATVNGLEDQLEDLKEELRKTKQELTVQRTQFFQLRALQDQTDQALGDVQGQLTQSETELNEAIDRNRNMEQQQLQLDNQVKELKQEINTLHANMAHLDREKDQLLMMLDEKTEKIVALERELQHKEQQVIGMEQQMWDLRHKHEICIDQSAECDRQCRAMQLEMENLQRQLETANADRENAIQENRRLQDDLASVTYELRNLQRDLDSARTESYDLKKQLQTYVSEVRRAEELLNRKESERSEMLNHFRSLSLEATVLENNNHSLESEAAEARGALQTAKDRLLDLERQLADKDSLIRGYETQISELTQTVASMETQLRQQTERRLTAEADLNTVRDLCIKLDQQKDALMQQFEEKDATKEQYETQLAGLKAEQDVIQDQIDRDHATVERLETLLDQARQESINAQTTNHELQNEISRLKQKIVELQTKLSSESLELKQCQNQAAEYSKQISELRRQVTNERFDRARKDEESRRYSGQGKCKDRCLSTCKICKSRAVSLGMSNGEYMKSDGGNESTANNKIQVDSSEKVWPDVMEPLAESTPDRHTNKSNISPCCMSPLPSEKMHVPTIVSEMPNQKHAPTKVSEIPNQKHGPTKVSEIPNQKHVSQMQNHKHDIFEPSNKNNNNFNVASYRCVSTQCMKINGQSPAVSDSSDYQFFNELEVSRKLLPCCTVSNDTNSSIEKLEKFIGNTSDKTTNENTINDTVEDIYIRNTKKRLRDNYKNDNVIHPARHRESVPSTVDTDADIKYVANFKETFSEFDAFTKKNLIPCDCNDREKVASDYTIDEIPQTMKQNDEQNEEQNEEECSCENKSYSHLTDTVTKGVIRNTEINEFHKTNASDVTNVAQPDDNKTTNDVKGPTQTNQCKTIVIICPKFKFKKIISDIKEHTKSLEQQIANINNIVKSIIILSDQKTSSVLEKENLTIFYEKSNENSNEPQTEKFVDRNNNNVEQVKHESTRGTNVDKHIKERALSTSSLTQKSPIHQEPVTTLIKENLIKNDEQISPHVKVKEEVPTIEMNTTKYEPDQINVKSTPHEHHETKHISYSDKTYTSAIETPEIEPTFVDSLTKNICDFTSCDTGYIHYSTLSDRDSISDLNLQTTFTQSSNCQIVAATSVSSNELNFNAKPTNCLVLRDNRRKSNNNDDVIPASMNVSTTIDDLKPSISIQCVTISNSSNCCIADLQALEITSSSPRDNLDKVAKTKRNKKSKLRKS